MALFTDGDVSSIEDLRGYDTQLLDVANTEGIDVTRKLKLAQDEIAAEITTMLARRAWSNAPVDPGRVVVTAPLKLWHMFLSLELVYRDAYRSQLNDRYAGKRDEFHGMVKWAWDKLIETGLGLVDDPVARAAAPRVLPAAGSLPDGTYYVAAAWTNAAGAEGTSSIPATIDIAGGSFAVQAIAGPVNAKGWNVYAGNSPTSLTRQNDKPLEPGETWLQSNSILTAGTPAGCGQAPDFLLPVPRILQRG
uniref:Uncharacterized protein n=1 Tax=Solibacter usitatus (strain Ellin6076) TaxID=234267 RepID=Q01Z38_SOLUE